MDDRNRAKRGGLDRGTIAEAALELLDEVGIDGLTVRRLAAELDVKSPALYWHFRTKQELLDLMAQELQASQDTRGPHEGEPWPEWVARRARERRRLLLSRRDGARLIVGTSPGTAIARTFETELRVLVGFGFTPVQALRAITSIGHYVTGFVMEEQAEQERRRDGEEGATARGRETAAADAPSETPTLAAAIAVGGPPESGEAFEQGLWMLIDGMSALLERSARGSR